MYHIEGIKVLKKQMQEYIDKSSEIGQNVNVLLQQKDELNDLINSLIESIKVLGKENQEQQLNILKPDNTKELLDSIPEVKDEN